MKSRILIVGAGVSGIATARGLLRDGHDVTVFDQRPDVTAGGGAVTIWSNGATVLDQLGVDMTGAGQTLSAVRVTTASGHPLATVDLHTMATRLGAPIRMVPLLGWRSPPMQRTSAVLPAPGSPLTATISPAPTLRSIPSSAVTGPNPTPTPETSSTLGG